MSNDYSAAELTELYINNKANLPRKRTEFLPHLFIFARILVLPQLFVLALPLSDARLG